MSHQITPTHFNHRLPLYIFLAAAIVLGALRIHHSRPAVSLTPVSERKPVPPLTVPLIDGGTWSLADHGGQVVLLNDWATWCGPCQEEAPTLVGVSEQYHSAQFAMLGISFDSGPDTQARIHQFVTRFHVAYPIALTTESWTTGVSQIALPTTVLLDRHGRIARTYTGPVDSDVLTRDIDALLDEI